MKLVLLIACVLSVINALGCQSSPRYAAAPTFTYQKFAVAADHPVASEAGAEILRAGGNAVDAAVAVSFTLSVVRPYSCGIGGGGFMVIHDPNANHGEGFTTTLNYREWAPDAVGPDFYASRENGASRIGGAAVAVPGTVAGLLEALERFGTLDRATVMGPAIRAARDGFEVDADFCDAVRTLAREVQRDPRLRTRMAYHFTEVFREGTLEPGDVITNPRQADALELIAEYGAEAFYAGPIGYAIVHAVERAGGVLTAEDLLNYRPEERAPIRGRFREFDLITMPPPSSGGIAMLQALTMLEARWEAYRRQPPQDAASVHLVTECLKHAFADRARFLADPNFIEVPMDQLLDADALKRRAWTISLVGTAPSEAYGTAAPLRDDAGTSHFSVIDARGMAVACTETINLSFGSLVEVPAYGFVLNNEMDDFTTKRGEANAFGLRQSDDNLPAPRKRPLSSMSPMIVLKDNRAAFIGGASGGPRIITATLQALLNALVHRLDAGEAVSRPRFHHQWLPDVLRLESGFANEQKLTRALEATGHRLEQTTSVGVTQIIVPMPGGTIQAASDPRKGGRPAGQ